MKSKEILQDVSKRPWLLPEGHWIWYQEWNDVLFLNWLIPINTIQPLVPSSLEIDTFSGNAWISLVAFTLEKIHPFGFPIIPTISDFHEINLRTYVKYDGKPGVYFLNIGAEKWFSAFLAKTLSWLPYEKTTISKNNKINPRTIISENKIKRNRSIIQYRTGNTTKEKTALDCWLTERYCLYLDRHEKIYRYDIHHKEWKLNEVELVDIDLEYNIGDISFNQQIPDSVQYSHGVNVLAWPRKLVKNQRL